MMAIDNYSSSQYSILHTARLIGIV